MRGDMAAQLPIEMISASTVTMRAMTVFVNERGFADVYVGASCLLDQCAGPTPCDRVAAQDVRHRVSPQRWPRQFFEATSCRIALSRLSSATSFFSRVFSSCSCLSSRTWSDCIPAYCFFQR